MIREQFVAFLSRISDIVFSGRNRSRIVLGTDRKKEIDTGYGDGGENDPESASIDIVAGFSGEIGNPVYIEDKSRIYLSGKTDPDDYFEINKGEAIEGEAAIVAISDNVYLKSRNKLKIIGPDYSIVLENGKLTIECDSDLEIKSGQNILKMNSSGVEIDAGNGISGKIITDNDICVGIDPVSGGPILSNFKNTGQGALVNNQKVIIK